MLKKLFLLLIIVRCLVTTAYSQSAYWQQQVNVDIDVTLHDDDHHLDGFIRIEYFNNSPDTLRFIWLHVWPNAYKNDRTAFSDQLLQNGSTRFYFSERGERGYINQLEVKVDGTLAKLEDHPQHQDILKIVLPQPLAPGNKAIVQTPFHVQLPHNFSRGGHVGQSYQVTQWYPKPAVYDRNGWHPMPYLDQGEFYSEFGNYKVQITLPKNYVVAATGELQDDSEKQWLANLANTQLIVPPPLSKKKVAVKPGAIKIQEMVSASLPELKTIRFIQDSVHDFAWFADKNFTLQQDSVQLPGGRHIKLAVYWPNTTGHTLNPGKSLAVIKKSILTRSNWLGEYPYRHFTLVQAPMGFPGGMEYPTIAAITRVKEEAVLEKTIEHEIGHQWNYGILATNERANPWMDEGINSYYGDRFQDTMQQNNSSPAPGKQGFFQQRVPENLEEVAFATIAVNKKDQPINTRSDSFNVFNYQLAAYYKAARWLQQLESKLGKGLFDKAMQEYYRRWKFKHPYPSDFKAVMEEVSGRALDDHFRLLDSTGLLPSPQINKTTRFTSFFNLTKPGQYHTISAAPMVGFNWYDQALIGGILHNYTLPAEKFQFFVAPLYGTGSKQLNGLGRMSYHWWPGNSNTMAIVSIAGASFSGDSFTDSAGNTTYQRFSKLVPSLKIIFPNRDPQSQFSSFLQWKTFLIREQGLLFSRNTMGGPDVITFPATGRYLNQLRFVVQQQRVLYPYDAELKIEQGKGFVRLALTGNYFFNYASKGGINVRGFAGKFVYIGEKTFLRQFDTDRYHLNMSGPKGEEDYTYSDYFVGRNEFTKMPSQQIMQRDGFFKVRTDLLSNKIGKSDDWLGALNVTADIPGQYNPLRVLPVPLPLKLFIDVGTYAGAWQSTAGTGKFIYDAGLQLSLFSNVVNIYVPILYSKVYSDYFKSTITEKRFLKNISFSIDIQQLTMKKLFPQFPAN